MSSSPSSHASCRQPATSWPTLLHLWPKAPSIGGTEHPSHPLTEPGCQGAGSSIMTTCTGYAFTFTSLHASSTANMVCVCVCTGWCPLQQGTVGARVALSCPQQCGTRGLAATISYARVRNALTSTGSLPAEGHLDLECVWHGHVFLPSPQINNACWASLNPTYHLPTQATGH